MFWGFHGLWLLLPLLLLGKFFWLIILALLIGLVVRRFIARNRQWAFGNNYPPFYRPGTPPNQASAMDILRQRYARGEIDAVTFDQMRERIEATQAQNQQ